MNRVFISQQTLWRVTHPWARLMAGRIPATNRFKSAWMTTTSDLQCTSCALRVSASVMT
ncbi:MAG TPA: hypothetical protein PLJ39_10110 [Spirochaetota bacterium]|nr:hypothetical protein [Spirochaetota bacterium]HPY03304.1 hypothetical protein [Spirochaetota bacterium]